MKYQSFLFLFLEEGRFVTMMILSIHLVSAKDGFNHKLFEFLELTSLINLKCFWTSKLANKIVCEYLYVFRRSTYVMWRIQSDTASWNIQFWDKDTIIVYMSLHINYLCKNKKLSIYTIFCVWDIKEWIKGHKKYTVQVSYILKSSTLIALPYVRMQFII